MALFAHAHCSIDALGPPRYLRGEGVREAIQLSFQFRKKFAKRLTQPDTRDRLPVRGFFFSESPGNFG
jgi:hypothetical protein